jgi:hypothetical protein
MSVCALYYVETLEGVAKDMIQRLPKNELAGLAVIPRWELPSRPSCAALDSGIYGCLQVSLLDLSSILTWSI